MLRFFHYDCTRALITMEYIGMALYGLWSELMLSQEICYHIRVLLQHAELIFISERFIDTELLEVRLRLLTHCDSTE